MRDLIKLLPLLLLIGCNRHSSKTCPAFNEANLSRIPYEVGDVLKYSNGDDTVSFTIKKKEILPENSYVYTNDCGCDMPCESNASIESEMDSVHGFGIHFQCIDYSELKELKYYFVFMKYDSTQTIYQSHGIETLWASNDESSLTFKDVQIGNKTYLHALFIDSDEPTRYDSLYIADSVGLIQFTDTETSEVWKRLEWVSL